VLLSVHRYETKTESEFRVTVPPAQTGIGPRRDTCRHRWLVGYIYGVANILTPLAATAAIRNYRVLLH